MLRLVSLLLPCLFFLCSCAQEADSLQPVITKRQHRLGDTRVTVSLSRYIGDSSLVFLCLHDNERTATEAAKVILQEKGGLLISIDNNEERYLDFRLSGRKHRFDPNRVFTPTGIRETLKLFNSYSPASVRELRGFASFLLGLLPDSGLLIAVHNNTDGNYSISDYLPNARLRTDVLRAHPNYGMDEDDFVFTTDSTVYRLYADSNINVVLQHNSRATDDGSLSIYYGRRNASYTNIEAEHGHLEEQVRMIRVLISRKAAKNAEPQRREEGKVFKP
jgi:hypothetical protein